MYVWSSFPWQAEGFQTYIHAREPLERLSDTINQLTVYVCLIYVCMFEAYIHAWGLQTYIHTCLDVSDIHTYIHSWGSMLKQAPGSSKNQVSSRLSRMLQNTYKNQGLDILFGPGRISEFWASEAPMTKSILTLLSMYVRFRLYYVNATGENWTSINIVS